MPQLFTIVFMMNCVASLHIIFIYNTHKEICMKDRYLFESYLEGSGVGPCSFLKRYKFNCCSIFIQVFSYLKLV